MANNILSENNLVSEIAGVVAAQPLGHAPYVLIVGSGFSHGLVPTVRETVRESLPLWISVRGNTKDFRSANQQSPEHKAQTAKEFWERFIKTNALRLPVHPENGIPIDENAAYRAAFSPRNSGALDDHQSIRLFLREVMRLDQNRLNAAHFLLGSILSNQPRPTQSSATFATSGAFSRLILTTNFDPFLQIALQLTGSLYIMSDTPELGINDDIGEDEAGIVHLAYVHGSVHRRAQAASDEQIADLKLKNAKTLQPILENRGVIVLGYSGWDDTLVEALSACKNIKNGLYWCGRSENPQKANLSKNVLDIISRKDSRYVKIDSANSFMARLHGALVKGLPTILSNPIGHSRQILESINLQEMDIRGTEQDFLRNDTTFNLFSETFVLAKTAVMDRLSRAEKHYLSYTPFSTDLPNMAPVESAGSTDYFENEAEWQLAQARFARSLGKFQSACDTLAELLNESYLHGKLLGIVLLEKALCEALAGNEAEAAEIYGRIIASSDVLLQQKNEAILQRAEIHIGLGRMESVEREITSLINDKHTSTDFLAHGLAIRSLVRHREKRFEESIADGKRALAAPHISNDSRFRTAMNIAIADGELGHIQDAISRLSELVSNSEAKGYLVTEAYYNRGSCFEQLGMTEEALSDYSLVVWEPTVQQGTLAKALMNRGLIWVNRKEWEKAEIDFTRIIRLQSPPRDELAKALCNRSGIFSELGRLTESIKDLEQAIGLTEVSSSVLAECHYNYGSRLCEKKDFATASLHFKNAISEKGIAETLLVRAFYDLGICYGNLGDANQAREYFTKLIAHPNSSQKLLALGHCDRATAYSHLGRFEEAFDDTSKTLALNGDDTSLRFRALCIRMDSSGRIGKYDQTRETCRAIIDLKGAPEETKEIARRNLAILGG